MIKKHNLLYYFLKKFLKYSKSRLSKYEISSFIKKDKALAPDDDPPIPITAFFLPLNSRSCSRSLIFF